MTSNQSETKILYLNWSLYATLESSNSFWSQFGIGSIRQAHTYRY